MVTETTAFNTWHIAEVQTCHRYTHIWTPTPLLPPGLLPQGSRYGFGKERRRMNGGLEDWETGGGESRVENEEC